MDKKTFLTWKEKYWNVYYAEIGDEEFLFRELSRSEYRVGKRLYDEEDTLSLEEYICQVCVLEPESFDFEECAAGIPSTLADLILYQSGFVKDEGRIEEYISRYSKEMATLDNQISCIIKEAFQDIPLEEIENWPLQKTLWYYSRALYTLGSLRGIQIGVQPITSETPAEAVQKQEPEQKRDFNFALEGEGSMSDFGELSEIDAFMKGRWNPPSSITEGEELL